MTHYTHTDPNPQERFDADPESLPCRACGQWYEDCACPTFDARPDYIERAQMEAAFDSANGRIAALAIMEQEIRP